MDISQKEKETVYEIISINLDIINTLQKRTFRQPFYNDKRNAMEEKWRLHLISESKKSIEFCKEHLKRGSNASI